MAERVLIPTGLPARPRAHGSVVGRLPLTLLVLTLGAFFFAAGNFGFLNVLGVRREAQVVLIPLLALGAPFVIARWRQWLRQPLWWMVAVALLAEVFIKERQTAFFLLGHFAAVYIVALLFSFSGRSSDAVLKTVIVLAAVFSTMVILQAAILWFRTDIQEFLEIDRFSLFPSSTQAARVELTHPIQYLGFTTPAKLSVFGHSLPRFRSFVSEPSAIITAFLAPGIMALGFRGVVRLAAAPILAFVVLLSASGTVYLSLALGVLVYPLLLVIRRGWVFLLLPFVLIPIWFVFVSTVDVRAFMTSISDWLAPLDAVYGVFNKVESGTVRLTGIADNLTDIKTSFLFGSATGQGYGLLLYMLLTGGIAGFILAILSVHKIFKLTINSLLARRRLDMVMAALLYGMMLQMMAFSVFGWVSVSGYMMLALMTQRAQSMYHGAIAGARSLVQPQLPHQTTTFRSTHPRLQHRETSRPSYAPE